MQQPAILSFHGRKKLNAGDRRTTFKEGEANTADPQEGQENEEIYSNTHKYIC